MMSKVKIRVSILAVMAEGLTDIRRQSWKPVVFGVFTLFLIQILVQCSHGGKVVAVSTVDWS